MIGVVDELDETHVLTQHSLSPGVQLALVRRGSLVDLLTVREQGGVSEELCRMTHSDETCSTQFRQLTKLSFVN